jgi:hypothetical protein
MHHALFESLFIATGMSLVAVGKEQRLSGLEITRDALVLYEGEPLDPLYGHGRVVAASEICSIRELKKTWFRKSAGLAVVYGRRFPLFIRNQQFIPAKTPQYSEIRDTLMALSSTAR